MTAADAGWLERRLRRVGPVTVAEFMAEALHHRQSGYYAAGDPLGAGGDFVTAPEVSQMFGELLGLWIVSAWTTQGAPADAALVELGPGRGTLMADAARAIEAAGAGVLVRTPHLVETSPVLRRYQAERLAHLEPVWHRDLSDMPDGPWFVIANEFLDALPIHQLVLRDGDWREVLVSARPDGDGLCWAVDRVPSTLIAVLPEPLRQSREDGLIAEVCPAAEHLVSDVAARISACGGAGLLVDYGALRNARGATLQAVCGHRPVDPLEAPGRADLSSHVDFARLRARAAAAGGVMHGPVEQGRFLVELGIRERAAALGRGGDADRRLRIERDMARLIDPGQMGTLFKVAAILPRGLDAPPGFRA